MAVNGNSRTWSVFVTGLAGTVLALIITAIIIATVTQIIINTGRLNAVEVRIDSLREELHRHMDGMRVPNVGH